MRWSPYRPTLLAVSAAQYYGIVGNGRLFILDCDPMSSQIMPVAMFESQDGQYDVAWSETNDNQLVSTCGDGSVKLWDLQVRAHPRPSPPGAHAPHSTVSPPILPSSPLTDGAVSAPESRLPADVMGGAHTGGVCGGLESDHQGELRDRQLG